MKARIAVVTGIAAVLITLCGVDATRHDRDAAPQQVAADGYASMIPSMVSVEMLQYMR